MAWKRLGVNAPRLAAVVRISRYRATPPCVRIPVSILAEVGIEPDSMVDVMVDVDVTPVLLAFVAGGSETKMSRFPGTDKFCQVLSTRLKQVVPEMASTAAEHEFTEIDGRKALVVKVPNVVEGRSLRAVA